MKIVRELSRVVTGLVFVFSGFVKAIDPAGSAIKFGEYFQAFQMEWLDFASLPMSVLLSAAEMTIGLNLILCIRMKLTGWLLLAFMSFFTLLTFILALSNPVSDCGCFGDAIKLTNWQTFWKNIILLAPTFVVFLSRDRYEIKLLSHLEWMLLVFNFSAAVLLSLYCLRHLPLLDFRPYRIGASIPAGMTMPEGAETDVYRTELVYEKNGIQQVFSIENYPWQDSTWKWVETRQKLIKKGYEPPIHDFSITSRDGVDITQEVLSDPGFTFLVVSPKLPDASARDLAKMDSLAIRSASLGIRFMGLTSSVSQEVEFFTALNKPHFEWYNADETTLQTIIRANPGLVLLKEGTIIGKWTAKDAPGPEELSSDMITVVLTQQWHSRELMRVAIVALILLAFYALFLPSARQQTT